MVVKSDFNSESNLAYFLLSMSIVAINGKFALMTGREKWEYYPYNNDNTDRWERPCFFGSTVFFPFKSTTPVLTICTWSLYNDLTNGLAQSNPMT